MEPEVAERFAPVLALLGKGFRRPSAFWFGFTRPFGTAFSGIRAVLKSGDRGMPFLA